MASKAMTLRIKIDGARETLAAFRRLPKEASDDLRRRTLALSELLAGRVAAAGRSEGGQAAAVASTVRATRDRVPAITVGGSARVTSRRVPAYKLIFGSEFGADRRTGWYAAPRYAGSASRQYRPHVERGGSYWIWRTVIDNEAEISTAWNRVVEDIRRSFASQ